MTYILVVTRPFGRYRRGDVIEDTTTIQEVCSGEHKDYVVRVMTATVARI